MNRRSFLRRCGDAACAAVVACLGLPVSLARFREAQATDCDDLVITDEYVSDAQIIAPGRRVVFHGVREVSNCDIVADSIELRDCAWYRFTNNMVTLSRTHNDPRAMLNVNGCHDGVISNCVFQADPSAAERSSALTFVRV